MKKTEIIKKDLIEAGFETFDWNISNQIISVRVPLPKRKRNAKTHLNYYGVIDINIDTCQVETCGIIIEEKGRIPNEEDLKFNQRKMIKAMSKIVDIIHNSRITKEFAIEVLKQSNVDEDIIDFVKRELYLDDLEELY